MRFNSKSVLLNDGVNMKVMVDIPEVFEKLDFPEAVWVDAIVNFNNRLNERPTVTEEVLGKPVDILQLEPGTSSIKLSIGVKREDVEAFEDVWFKLKGQIVFKANSFQDVESINITDLIYTNAEGEKVGVFNKT